MNNIDMDTLNKMFFPESVKDTAEVIILGGFGKGDKRKENIEKYTPYTYEEVRKEVNKMIEK